MRLDEARVFRSVASGKGAWLFQTAGVVCRSCSICDRARWVELSAKTSGSEPSMISVVGLHSWSWLDVRKLQTVSSKWWSISGQDWTSWAGTFDLIQYGERRPMQRNYSPLNHYKNSHQFNLQIGYSNHINPEVGQGKSPAARLQKLRMRKTVDVTSNRFCN